MSFIKHKFGKTFYTKIKCHKKSKKTSIVFLHGGPGGTQQSFLQLKELASDFDLYFYDQVGGGQSSPTPEKFWNIKTFVEELSILVDKWKLEEFVIVSGSWGTTLALEYFLKTKDKRLKKIVFQSPLFSTSDWEADAKRLIKKLPTKTQKIINYCHEIEATDSKVYKEAMFQYYLKHVLRNEKLLKDPKRKPNPHGNRVYEYMWGPSEFKATGTLKNYEKVKDLHKVKIPVLLICGKYDEATPETSRKYQKKFPNAKFKMIANASHSIARENPKAYLKELKMFL